MLYSRFSRLSIRHQVACAGLPPNQCPAEVGHAWVIGVPKFGHGVPTVKAVHQREFVEPINAIVVSAGEPDRFSTPALLLQQDDYGFRANARGLANLEGLLGALRVVEVDDLAPPGGACRRLPCSRMVWNLGRNSVAASGSSSSGRTGNPRPMRIGVMKRRLKL